ncbi:hypothetical protein G7043_25735 [Lentzea sp. NEAU-D13]|uniref:Endoglucanase B carbohydrate binding domain-containing protein n=1 Tax=Lentzea alba TaxID=2714351 RepID=A0A7C9RTB3_9PSEU|nr:hypothetical protein [Lentzea alba]NGY62329.1 hypothetical protein [Lentzea alba]
MNRCHTASSSGDCASPRLAISALDSNSSKLDSVSARTTSPHFANAKDNQRATLTFHCWSGTQVSYHLAKSGTAVTGTTACSCPFRTKPPKTLFWSSAVSFCWGGRCGSLSGRVGQFQARRTQITS